MNIFPPETSLAPAEAIQRFNAVAEAIPQACLLVSLSNSQVLAANSRAHRLLPGNIVGQALTEQATNSQHLSDSLSLFANSRSAMPGGWQLRPAPMAENQATLNLSVTGALFGTDNDKTLLITLSQQGSDNDGPFAELNDKLVEIQHERHQLQRDNRTLENEVAGRTKKLELRNEELGLLNQSLNDFVSVVSHDLAGSARRIQSFSTLLQRELPDEMKDGNTGDFLKFLVESAERLTQMIDGSVRLSRIQPSSDQWSRIETDSVLTAVVTDLRALHPTVEFTINYQNLHALYSDAGLVEQLIQNLINNAIKFRQVNTPLVINVSSSINTELDYVEVTITDNGQGISEHELQRVTRPFSRGSGVQHIPGTGMGLPMCIRICQQHQGRLWIEHSSTGEDGTSSGTEIRFRLPATMASPGY